MSGKNPDKLQAAGSFLMKVFGALAVWISEIFVWCVFFDDNEVE